MKVTLCLCPGGKLLSGKLEERGAIDRLVKTSVGGNAFGFECCDEDVAVNSLEGFAVKFEDEVIAGLACDAWIARQQFNTINLLQARFQLLGAALAQACLLFEAFKLGQQNGGLKF